MGRRRKKIWAEKKEVGSCRTIISINGGNLIQQEVVGCDDIVTSSKWINIVKCSWGITWVFYLTLGEKVSEEASLWSKYLSQSWSLILFNMEGIWAIMWISSFHSGKYVSSITCVMLNFFIQKKGRWGGSCIKLTTDKTGQVEQKVEPFQQKWLLHMDHNTVCSPALWICRWL